MTETGLPTVQVTKEISRRTNAARKLEEQHERRLEIVEAVLLALVAVLAAYSGYAAAKWSTESRLDLAHASTAHTQASTHELAAMSQRNFDSSTFEAWFTAWTLGNADKEAVAERRFTPNMRRAFNAWMATNPETNPNAPPGPTYMPQYKQPEVATAARLNAKGNLLSTKGAVDGQHSDDFVRVTVYLATVLFLLALSSHFRIRSVRIGLVVVSAFALVLSLIDIAALPRPPL